MPGEIDALFAEELALYFELEALRTRSLVFLLPAERMASQCVLYADLVSAYETRLNARTAAVERGGVAPLTDEGRARIVRGERWHCRGSYAAHGYIFVRFGDAFLYS